MIKKCLLLREMEKKSATNLVFGGNGGSAAVSSQFLNRLAEFLRVRFKKWHIRPPSTFIDCNLNKILGLGFMRHNMDPMLQSLEMMSLLKKTSFPYLSLNKLFISCVRKDLTITLISLIVAQTKNFYLLKNCFWLFFGKKRNSQYYLSIHL